MIIFKKVKFKNFLSYGNNFTELNLNRKSNTLIVGKNGVGKSSIITDTLTFALYNKPYRKINKNSIANSINKKECLVELEFDKNSDNYVVKRGISPNIFEIYKNGELINQKADNKDYQKLLEDEILQMNYNAFVQTIIIGKKYIPFMQLNTSDRRSLIEELFDINYFTSMNTVNKIKSKLNIEKINDLKYEIENCNNLIKSENNTLEILNNQNNENIEKINNKINELNENIKENEVKIDKILSKYKELKKNIVDNNTYIESINKLNFFEKQLLNENVKLNKENDFYHNSHICSVCKQEINEDFKNNIIDSNNQTLDLNANKLNKINTKKNELNNQLKNLNDKNNEINDQLMKLNNEYHKLLANNENNQENIKKLNKELKQYENKDHNVNATEENIKKLNKELNAKTIEFDKCNLDKIYYDIITNILKDDGLKTYLIKMFLPKINDIMAKYMDIFNFNCSFTLDEQFNEVIRSRFRDKFTYYNFSEGEKLRIDLALLFVFRELAKERNSVNTNLLILDEVLDSSLDEEGINGFLTILRTIEADKDVFIISHHSEKYYNLFPNVIEIGKKINYSEIKVDTFIGNYGKGDDK